MMSISDYHNTDMNNTAEIYVKTFAYVGANDQQGRRIDL